MKHKGSISDKGFEDFWSS